MDETQCFLEMGFNTTLDFRGKKNVLILSSGRDYYRISLLLSKVANCIKLPPFIIIKGESGKTIMLEMEIYLYIANHKAGILHLYSNNGLKSLFCNMKKNMEKSVF